MDAAEGSLIRLVDVVKTFPAGSGSTPALRGVELGVGAGELVFEPDDYRRERARASRVPQLLATTLYAAFTRQDGGTAALRRAMIQLWHDPGDRRRTMRLLSTEETRTAVFYGSFLKVLALSAEDALLRRRPGGLDGFD